ncbi:MAG: hypothetical protein MI757_20060 [Pirellulales bacterium]|nr:hypothetical protein [Pirellulales bacterium]
MFPNKVFVLLLVGALGVPYAVTKLGSGKGLSGLFSSSSSTTSSHSSPTVSGVREDVVRQRVEQETKDLSPTRQASQPLKQFFDFGITKGWVRGRWKRVSTQLSSLELQGYRVPLVTGTAVDDLAGSLTYYFDSQQRLQRISFQGTTGDFNRLTNLLASQFDMIHKPTNDTGLVLVESRRRWGTKQVSQLRIRDASVASADDTHRRFQLALVLERPPGA